MFVTKPFLFNYDWFSDSIDVNGGDVTSYELTDLLPSTLYITYVAALHRNDELDKVGPAVATTFTGKSITFQDRDSL